MSILTTYAFTGSAYVVPSACGKAGVFALTQSLAVEWGKHGIRLNAIAPGAFESEGAWSRLLPGKLMNQYNPSKYNALNRFGQHSELNNLAAYLISNYAAFITGEMIVIDGGQWLKGAGQFSMLHDISQEKWDDIEQLSRKGKSS